MTCIHYFFALLPSSLTARSERVRSGVSENGTCRPTLKIHSIITCASIDSPDSIHTPGGKDCFSLSAFSLSVTTRV